MKLRRDLEERRERRSRGGTSLKDKAVSRNFQVMGTWLAQQMWETRRWARSGEGRTTRAELRMELSCTAHTMGSMFLSCAALVSSITASHTPPPPTPSMGTADAVAAMGDSAGWETLSLYLSIYLSICLWVCRESEDWRERPEGRGSSAEVVEREKESEWSSFPLCPFNRGMFQHRTYFSFSTERVRRKPLAGLRDSDTHGRQKIRQGSSLGGAPFENLWPRCQSSTDRRRGMAVGPSFSSRQAIPLRQIQDWAGSLIASFSGESKSH